MWSANIRVHPWVGDDFNQPRRLPARTLLLGESNYTTPEKFNNDLVRSCVLDDMKPEDDDDRDTSGFCRFSTKLRRVIFSGDVPSPSEFWREVAFYNFVQYLVGEDARVRPAEEMWHDSLPAFVEVVCKLDVRRVLVLGLQNWSNLLHHLPHTQANDDNAVLNVHGLEVPIARIQHPSSSLVYADWRPIAQSFLFGRNNA